MIQPQGALSLMTECQLLQGNMIENAKKPYQKKKGDKINAQRRATYQKKKDEEKNSSGVQDKIQAIGERDRERKNELSKEQRDKINTQRRAAYHSRSGRTGRKPELVVGQFRDQLAQFQLLVLVWVSFTSWMFASVSSSCKNYCCLLLPFLNIRQMFASVPKHCFFIQTTSCRISITSEDRNNKTNIQIR